MESLALENKVRVLIYVRGRETTIYQPERRLSYQLPFWISGLGAGS